MSFCKAYCLHKHIVNEYQIIKTACLGSRAHTVTQKGGADCAFPRCNTFCSHREHSEEIVNGSGRWVRDGLALSQPAFPRSNTLSGGSLHWSSLPLSESVLLQQFFSKEIYIVFISKWLGNMCITVILGSLYEIFHIRPFLLVWLFGCI